MAIKKGPRVPVMLSPPWYAADKPLPKVRFAKEDIVFKKTV